ncbi:MAG: hypothetical protein KA154_10280 [Gemmatimonadaceae bacterium]|nr:hypothetical protein [Gemmatimonadaceae bacterium]MCC6431079.1 hypothetical protein [Gemmatimonadaceae bacterium]
MTDATTEDASLRTKALIAMVVAICAGAAGWYGFSTAAQRGIDRLAAIDKGRATCAISWAAARTRAESLMVDGIALADTIDPRSEEALRECGDLRDKGTPTTAPNAREMNGEPMPRGLR